MAALVDGQLPGGSTAVFVAVVVAGARLYADLTFVGEGAHADLAAVIAVVGAAWAALDTVRTALLLFALLYGVELALWSADGAHAIFAADELRAAGARRVGRGVRRRGGARRVLARRARALNATASGIALAGAARPRAARGHRRAERQLQWRVAAAGAAGTARGGGVRAAATGSVFFWWPLCAARRAPRRAWVSTRVWVLPVIVTDVVYAVVLVALATAPPAARTRRRRRLRSR